MRPTILQIIILRCGGLGPPHRSCVGAWGPHMILLNRALHLFIRPCIRVPPTHHYSTAHTFSVCTQGVLTPHDVTQRASMECRMFHSTRDGRRDIELTTRCCRCAMSAFRNIWDGRNWIFATRSEYFATAAANVLKQAARHKTRAPSAAGLLAADHDTCKPSNCIICSELHEW